MFLRRQSFGQRQPELPEHRPGVAVRSTLRLSDEGNADVRAEATRRQLGGQGYSGCSLWIDPPRARWVVLLSNRVYPTGGNDAIKRLRPQLHDAIVQERDAHLQ